MGTVSLERAGEATMSRVPRPTMDLPAEATAWPVAVVPSTVVDSAARQQRTLMVAPKTPLRRRVIYAVFRSLPLGAQRLAIRLGAAKVTYGACAVIQDGRGRVLLAHHTYRRRAWGLPGGLVGRHEQPYDAIERELREELGLRAQVGPLLYAETCLANGHLTLYYRATIAGMPRTDGVEVDSFQYATLDDAASLLGPEALPWLDCLRTRRAS